MKKRIIIGSSLVLIIDQLTKYLVETFTSNKIIKIIPNFFNIDFTYNEGGAFSILNGQIILLIALTIICLFFLNTFYKDLKDTNFKTIIFSLLYGGIIGNLIDRIFIHSVRDFFDFKFFNYHFPTFNVADMAIVIGMFLLIIKLFRKDEVK